VINVVNTARANVVRAGMLQPLDVLRDRACAA